MLVHLFPRSRSHSPTDNIYHSFTSSHVRTPHIMAIAKQLLCLIPYLSILMFTPELSNKFAFQVCKCIQYISMGRRYKVTPALIGWAQNLWRFRCCTSALRRVWSGDLAMILSRGNVTCGELQVDTLRLRINGHHFPNDIFKCIFFTVDV